MRNNFIEVLTNEVEIPIIQRDYAQGRTDKKTEKIRKDFLDALFDFIQHKQSHEPEAEIELDFIYGFTIEKNASQTKFIPIDGQQRLTTLWLLYWFTSVKEESIPEDNYFLRNFLYETRHSTTEFCKQLTLFQPNFNKESIGNEIKNQPWYFETWDFDPSVQAMIIVLNDIEKRYKELKFEKIWNLIKNDSCPFYFYKLDMSSVGLSDDLYIKMNSRGKGLTEFEYFKAGFSELIINDEQKEKFENSIDGEWIDCIWHLVFSSNIMSDDIAQEVDNAFLNIFNFITSVIALKKDIKTPQGNRYEDTINSADLVKSIYADYENRQLLFNILDAISDQQKFNSSFWNDTFYFAKDEYQQSKSRLFFQHKEVNLLKRCLSVGRRGLTFPEQILLYSCFHHLVNQNDDFDKRIRNIRNLSINSENELRETILGDCFNEVDKYLEQGDLNIFKEFKTDQIDEEKNKERFLNGSIKDLSILRKLEDSDILRGSISLFPFDDKLEKRASKYLELFEENDIVQDFNNKSNLLLCFGDYSQNHNSLTNLMAKSKIVIRSFFTTPGYNKAHFYTKTQSVTMDCIDYFVQNNTISATQKISDTLSDYSAKPKGWRYYFLKYPSFKNENQYGYYEWRDSHYCIWKMGKKQFNGYHWDPFLYEARNYFNSKKLTLGNYGIHDKLVLSINKSKILISSLSYGFLFENGNTAINNALLEELIVNKLLNHEGKLLILQNENEIDLEDRIEKLKSVLNSLLS